MPLTASGKIPVVVRSTARIAAVAAGSDSEIAVGEAPFDCTVAVSFVPDTTLTGANTDSRTLQAFNKGAAGAGTTKIAEKAYTSGVNITAFDEDVVTASAVANATEATQGDVISFKSLHVGGTGLASPAGLVIVEYTQY